MAKLRCKCGTQLRDDDPEHSGLLFSNDDYDHAEDVCLLRGRATEVWGCPECGRLWIFWEKMSRYPTEYVRQPAVSGDPE
jgi:hypothetical protein